MRLYGYHFVLLLVADTTLVASTRHIFRLTGYCPKWERVVSFRLCPPTVGLFNSAWYIKFKVLVLGIGHGQSWRAVEYLLLSALYRLNLGLLWPLDLSFNNLLSGFIRLYIFTGYFKFIAFSYFKFNPLSQTF